MKFYMGTNTWYIAEIDHNDWDTMFCYMVDERTKQGSWGYSSLKKLMNVKFGFVQVDRDLYEVTPYSPKKLSQLRGK